MTSSVRRISEVLYSGTMIDESGSAVSSAQVVMLAWPTSDELASLAPGDAVPTAIVGNGFTDAAGQFKVRLDTAAARTWLSKRPSEDTLDVQITSTSDAGVASTSMSIPIRSRLGIKTITPQLPLSAQDFTTELAGNSMWRPAVPLERGSVGLDLVAQGAPAAAAPSAPYGGCMNFVRSLGRRPVTLTALSGTSSQWSSEYEYAEGQSSTLGIGFSYEGTKGTFKGSGTTSRKAGVTAGWGENAGSTGSREYRTRWEYGLYYGTGCSPRGVSYYQVKPIKWTGETEMKGSPEVYNASHCSSVAKGGYAKFEKQKQSTMSGGVSISSIIGINLSAQTGFSSNGRLTIRFKKQGQLCGSRDVYTQSNAGALVFK